MIGLRPREAVDQRAGQPAPRVCACVCESVHIVAFIYKSLLSQSDLAAPPAFQGHMLTTTHPPISAQAGINDFDGTPIKASLFLRDIGEYAAHHGMLTLLLQGWFVSKNTIICASSDVVPLVKAHYQDPVNNPLPNDIQHPPNPPTMATRASVYNPTVEDKKLFVASPELFMHQCAVVLQQILNAIKNPDVARRIRQAAKGDARLALLEIVTIRNELTSAQIAHHLQMIAKLAKTGIAEPNAPAFASFKDRYEKMAFALPKTHSLPDSYIAQDYRRAILPLGDEICLLISTEIKIRSAESDPEVTAQAISMVLDEYTLSHQGTHSDSGNAFTSQMGRENKPPNRARNPDPRKHPNPNMFQQNRSQNSNRNLNTQSLGHHHGIR